MTPIEFLNALWEPKPADLFILIWTLQGKRSHWFRDVDAAARFAAAHCSDVYVGVGLAKQDYGPHHRCLSETVAGIAGFWADFDLRSDAHAKPLPATIDEALSLIPADLPPTFIVVTGNGVHVWWLFKEPWIFANENDRKDAAVLSYRFQTLLGYHSTQRGWEFERLADLARILRIPGTINAKDPKKPKRVELYSRAGHRYDPSDFRQHLDHLSIPDQEAEERAANATAERFADQSLVINQDATMPQDMLARWMEQDLRFRNTWKRQREDLSDPSQSAYDMALADFGVAAGLAEQQITDLIIHHRRIHGQERRTRLDYFQRTISKAKRTAGPRFSFAGASTELLPPADEENSLAAGNGADDSIKKAMLCQQISQILGIRILRLLKFNVKDPVYFVECEEGLIEFPDVGKFIEQKAVSLALAAKVGKVMRKFTASAWREVAQMLLDACMIEEGTDDLQYKGAIRLYLTQYLSEVGVISSLEGEVGPSLRKPMIHDVKITISATDLQMFVNKTTMQNISVKAMAAMMMALGSKPVRIRGKGFKEQSRWALPVEEFDPMDYQQHQEDAHGDK